MALRTAVVLMTCLSSLPALAHEDAILSLSGNGEIERIPPQYGPVVLTGIGPSEAKADVVLRVGAKEIKFPACISNLFRIPQAQEIRILGSWYHDRRILPYYLSIELPRFRTASGFMNGYSVLVNLETGELIEVYRHRTSDDGETMRREEFLGQLCSELERKALVPRPVAQEQGSK